MARPNRSRWMLCSGEPPACPYQVGASAASSRAGVRNAGLAGQGAPRYGRELDLTEKAELEEAANKMWARLLWGADCCTIPLYSAGSSALPFFFLNDTLLRKAISYSLFLIPDRGELRSRGKL